jgi:hypothetical protein
MDTELVQKVPNKFICVLCDYNTSRFSQYKRHLNTSKHINSTTFNSYEPLVQKKKGEHKCDNCGKKYKERSGLWKHNKICNSLESTNTNTIIKSNDNDDFKKLILEVIKNNTDLQKQNSELQKQLIEVCKNSNSISNSNINSNNKTFNLQFFLNEQCKDAMNISEFVNTFELELSDLESVGELGYVEGITKQIVDKLNSMDIYKRPMHCSDAKRETIYIKDDNKWEKEQRNNPKLRRAIKNLSFNNMKLIGKWSDTYPESKSSESYLNDKYMKLVKQTTGGNGDIIENEDRIIRRIVKEILIEKN